MILYYIILYNQEVRELFHDISDIFITGDGGYTILWFFWSLFLTEICFYFIRKHFRRGYSIVVIIMAIAGLMAFYYNIPNISKIPTSGLAILYYSMGYWIKKAKWQEMLVCRCKIMFIPIAAINVLVSLFIYKNFGWAINMYSNQHVFFPLEFICVVTGCYCVCQISVMLQNLRIAKPLQYIGRNSKYFYPLTAYVPNYLIDLVRIMHIQETVIVKVLTRIIGFLVPTAIVEIEKWIKKAAIKKRNTSLE